MLSNHTEGRAAVVLRDRVRALASTAVLERAGWAVVGEDAEVDVTISDAADEKRPPTVAVVDALPYPCHEAVRALMHGAVQGAVVADDIVHLAVVARTAAAGFVVVSPIALALAATAPELTERQEMVLASLAAGASVPSVARRLHQSVTTVKRDVAAISELLGVSSRAELVREAVRLGLVDSSRNGSWARSEFAER